MDLKKTRQIIISKEDAVFRMDANGAWHNDHGKFQHPGIIKHFNASIRKDENGYFVYQSSGEVEEKVYFPYEDTAVFAIDLREEEELIIVLNTGEAISLKPNQLSLKKDCLYLQTPEHLIKFNTRAMMKLSNYLEERGGTLSLTINGKIYQIS